MKTLTKILLVIILETFIIKNYAQKPVLYDNEGYLIFNTNYCVDKSTLKDIWYFEHDVLYKIYNSIEYPQRLYENGIQGYVIAELDIFKSKDSLSCTIVKYSDFQLRNLVKKEILENKKMILENIRSKDFFKIYIPIKFEIIGGCFLNDIEENKCVKIRNCNVLEPNPLRETR